MNDQRLIKGSMTASVVAWFLVFGLLLVPMSEGGMAAFACLLMLGIATGITALDIWCTRSFRKPNPGCLTQLYFGVWSVSTVFWLFIMTRVSSAPASGTEGAAVVHSYVYAVPMLFSGCKIIIGFLVRRGEVRKAAIRQGA